MHEVVQRSCGYSNPDTVQAQVGWDFEQSGLVKHVPALSRGLELDDLLGPFQPK